MSERKNVGGEIAFDPRHTCKRSDIATLDHGRPDGSPIVNRVCLTCLTHWYGEAGVAVFEFPRRVWEAWMTTGLISKGGSA
jgi:hypothetical protein